MKLIRYLFFFLLLASATRADIERFTLVDTDSLTIKSEDGSATLRVEVERFDRDELKTVQKGEDMTLWHGKRQLPFDVMLIPTMIKSFELTIDGERVNIPKNFWNDIGGLQLRKLVVDPRRPVKTPQDDPEYEEFLANNQRNFPTLSRTPQGSTILISWSRPEE